MEYGESSVSSVVQPPRSSLSEIELLPPRIVTQSHEVEPHSRALPLSSRDKNLLLIIAFVIAVLVGYENTVIGGAIASTEFSVRLFPIEYRGKALVPQDNYCLYSSFPVNAFSSALHIGALVSVCGVLFVKFKLQSFSLRVLLLTGSIVHLVGSIFAGSLGFVLPALFFSRALQGVGVGILLQAAADLLLQNVAKGNDLFEFLSALFTAIGPPLATAVNLILNRRGVLWAWRISFSLSGVLSLVLIPLSLLLDVSSSDAATQGDLKISFSQLRKYWVELLVSIARILIAPLTDLKLYGTIIIMYFYPDDIVTYYGAFGLSLGDSIGVLLAHIFMGPRRRKIILVSCQVALITQVIVGTLMHFAHLRGKDKQISLGVVIVVLVFESIFMICRMFFTRPWLQFNQGVGDEMASSSIMQIIDLLLRVLMFLFTAHIVCFLGGTLFYLLAAMMVAVALFIVIGVPETARVSTVEEQVELLRSYRFWKIFF